MRRVKPQDSPQRHKIRVKIWHSIVLLLASLFAISILCLAWFINNIRVSTEAISISTQGERFFLSTLDSAESTQGIYDNLTSVPYANNLGDVETLPLTERLLNFIVGTQQVVIDGNTYRIGDTEKVSLMVTPDSNMSNYEANGKILPGASGTLTFYIIPNVDDLGTVNLTVKLEGYQIVKNGTSASRQPVDASTAQLLAGHMLLFRERTAGGQYRGWIPSDVQDGTVSTTISLNQTFTKDVPVAVTLYWVWPMNFRNLQATGRDTSIFLTPSETETDYTSWLTDVNTYPSQYGVNLPNPAPTVETSMSNLEFAAWNRSYNMADQRIGTAVSYLQVSLSAEEAISAQVTP